MQGDQLVRTDRLELDVDGERTEVPELVGRPQPDLLLVNDDDLAYAKIRLDERSTATAVAHPRGFADSLPRALVLGAAWDMTRDAEMPGRDFVELALSSLPGETDSTLLRTLLSQMQATVTMYVAPQHRAAVAADVVSRLRDLVASAEPGSDAQLQLVTAFAGYAQAPEDTAYLQSLLTGSTVLDGLAIDTEMRWTLLTGLATAGVVGAAEIEAERERDNTATGRERAARALAALPTAEAKADAWQKAVAEDRLANQTVAAVGIGFGRAHDPQLLAPYVATYHDALLDVWTSRTHAIAESIVELFYPQLLASRELADATQGWLDAHADAPAGLRRLVAENRDGITRALAAQERDAARG